MTARTAARVARLLVAAALSVHPLAAQELHGVLRLPDGATPASGVVLEASRSGTRLAIARAITGENGAFSIRVPAAAVSLRALRIGFRPTELGEFTLAQGERRRVDLTLSAAPVVLSAVTSRAASRCERLDRAGEVVATLFDEARKALRATLLTPPEGRPAARVLLEQVVTEPNGRARSLPSRIVREGFSARPFRSAPPAQLAALGYAHAEPDGGTTYFAPDADVVLSDQFAAAHCLRVARADARNPERIGIAFEPTERRSGHVNIRGTLWLDSASLALERLEFSYVGLPGRLDEAHLGGAIEFSSLPDGLWFEDRWEIRMPRLKITQLDGSATRAVDGSGDRIELEAVQIAGGRVLSVTRADRVLYASAGDEIELRRATEPVEAETAAMLARAGCVVEELDASSDGRSTLVGLVSEVNARPAVGARVEATWKDGFTMDPGGNIRWTERTATSVAADDGFYALCGLPRDRQIPVHARDGERRTPRTVVRFERRVDHMRTDLRFPPAP